MRRVWNRRGALFGVAVGVLLAATPAHAQKTRDIAARAFPSVVLLIMRDTTGAPAALASGFFVRDDVIATNYHVIKEAAGGHARIVGRSERHRLLGVLASDPANDLALLKVVGVTAL